ncbi:MAG: glycoside hydrolase family 5 protein [Sphingobacteriaceae bacterium]|nr:glycoside hydrolase family 5 protein [Sphingobacteriaceae bacterium]
MITKTSFVVFALALTLNTVSAQEVKQYGQLKVTGTQLTDKHGKPVILRGMSFGWHNWWPRFYNQDAVKWLHRDWKCSVLRIAVGVEPHDAYLQNPAKAKEKIKAVVDQALKEGIYVIIDWHSHTIQLNQAKAFFSEMATLYGKHPNVIYEIFNEPEKNTWPEIKAYSTEVISAIRKIDKDNIILVGTPRWDQEIHIAADDPIQGQKNIMYTVHFYAATHGKWLRERSDYALKKGLPIFISECAGMEASGNGPVNSTEWNEWMNWADKNKVSRVIWSISDKKETCSVLYPTASSNGNWKDSDLTPWGTETRNMLRSYYK